MPAASSRAATCKHWLAADSAHSSQVQCPRVLRPSARAEAGRGPDQGWLLLPQGARLFQGHRQHAAVPRQVGPASPWFLTFLPIDRSDSLGCASSVPPALASLFPWWAENCIVWVTPGLGEAYIPLPPPYCGHGQGLKSSP